MTLESSPTTPPNPGAPRRAKYRLRFRKAGHLRLVSHHDLMHCFERMLRRAALPLCTTQGFHPQPRMVFAQSLALGVVGSEEVLELEMSEELTPEDVHTRLAQQAPPGIEILRSRLIDCRLTGQVRRAFYRLEIPATHREGLAERVEEFLTQTEAWVERTRPRPRRLNLRPFVHRLTLVSLPCGGGSAWGVQSPCTSFPPPQPSAAREEGDLYLEMALWVSPYGSARPDEVARLLGLHAVLDEGGFFDRYHLELHDETAPDDRDAPPDCLLQKPQPSGEDAPVREEPHAVRPHNLIPGPLSFDS